MKITYFVEILSSWCYWTEPTWAELKKRYADRVSFEWKIALMRPEDFPISPAQCDWFYQRSGTIMKSSFKLNPAWLEPERKGNYQAPNLVAEAARSLGASGDEVRLALTQAALRDGKKIGDISLAVRVAAAASGIDGVRLRTIAESKEIEERVAKTTAEFQHHQISQRPAFVLEDDIGDKAVFSGLVRYEPLAATIEAMLTDTAGYATHKAHFGSPPQV